MGMNNKKAKQLRRARFIFFALAPTGSGLSGGDRIFIEFAREWAKELPLKIYTTIEGVEMIKRQKLDAEYLEIMAIGSEKLPDNFILKYLYKVLLGVKLGLSVNLNSDDKQKSQNTFIYSSSDFWMDVFPAFILKLRYPNIKWIAAWYQTAPSPLKGFSEGDRRNRYKISALFYWLSQLPIKPLITIFADYVFVNNNEETRQFAELNKAGKVIIILGAVRIADINDWIHRNNRDRLPKVYDAVFQGRFHPQKGVVELIDIWKKVVNKLPNAKLAMIGDGPLMEKVKFQISNYKLQNNIKLFGYMFDGPEKYRIFAQSRVVVHPAFYDSGGMAAAEAMAFEIPCIGFDLPSYKSYYPKGMIKVKIGDLDNFSSKILKYLDDNSLRQKDGKLAQDFIKRFWSWKARAHEVKAKIIKE